VESGNALWRVVRTLRESSNGLQRVVSSLVRVNSSLVSSAALSALVVVAMARTLEMRVLGAAVVLVVMLASSNALFTTTQPSTLVKNDFLKWLGCDTSVLAYQARQAVPSALKEFADKEVVCRLDPKSFLTLSDATNDERVAALRSVASDASDASMVLADQHVLMVYLLLIRSDIQHKNEKTAHWHPFVRMFRCDGGC
jgi:hypothetical protein